MNTDNTADVYYIFDLDENGCPRFTDKNCRLVRALIRYDSKYGPTEYPKSYKEENTDTYVKLLENGFPEDWETMMRVVRSIDAVNSTHLSSEGAKGGNAGREITVEKIMCIPQLKERIAKADDAVVSEIASAVEGRFNISFASKFCAFTSLYALKKDNYCIYDRVIQSILPYYAVRYGARPDAKTELLKNNRAGQPVSTIEKMVRSKGYGWYREWINTVCDGIQASEGQTISYRQFDQLIWYYFKGRNGLIQSTLEKIAL